MVEVTRLRAGPKSTPAATQEQTGATPAPKPTQTIPLSERLADTVCSKLGQFLPQYRNLLLVGVEALPLTQNDLRAAMRHIQQHAERHDSTFWQRYRYRDRADFFQDYQRLSEILVRGSHLQTADPPIVWVNPQAKYPLPGKVRTVL